MPYRGAFGAKGTLMPAKGKPVKFGSGVEGGGLAVVAVVIAIAAAIALVLI